MNNVLDVFWPYVLICGKITSRSPRILRTVVWLATYEQVAVIVPYMAAAPLLFAVDESRITLGILVQISNAWQGLRKLQHGGRQLDERQRVAQRAGAPREFDARTIRMELVHVWATIPWRT